MLGNRNSWRRLAGRIAVFAIFFLIFTSITAAGPNVAVFSFPDPTNGLSGSRTASPPVTCAPPPAGMVGWWAGDGTTLDGIGGNDGTWVGSPGYSAGMVGQALSFNGANYVEIPDAPALRPNLFTADAWVYPTNTVGNHNVVFKGDHEYLLQIRNGNVLFGSKSATGAYAEFQGSLAVPVNTWSHVAITHDGTTKRIYVNGVLDPVTQDQAGHYTTNTGSLKIGTHNAIREFFHGYVDEVDIFDRNLTQVEIQAIYNAGSAGKCRTCVPPPPNMVDWWPANGNGTDIMGGQTATLANGATYSPGRVDQAFSFDGINDYASAPASSNWAFGTGDFTVELWMFNSANDDHRPIVNNRKTPASNNMWALEIYPVANRVEFHSGLTIFLTANDLLTSSSWNHVAVTRNGTTLTIYINGVASGSVANSSNFSEINDLQIGRDIMDGNGLGGRTFPGQIDELSVYRQSLSAAEIAAIYYAGSAGKCRPCAPPPANMVSWWPGDGNPNDIQGPTFENGMLVNGATYAAGRVGQAFDFDGSNDHVSIAPSSLHDFGTGNFTIDAWIYPRSLGSDQALVSRWDLVNGLAWDFRLGWPSGGGDNDKLYFFLGDNANNGIRISNSVEPNQWHHVAVVRNNGTLYGFLDGVEYNAGTHSGNATSPNARLRIGNIPGYETGFFHGLIDEAEIFNRALAASELQAIYASGSAGKCKECVAGSPNTVSWWRAEDNAIDRVDGNHGALQNGAGFAAGAVGRAFSLDGSDDVVNVPDAANLNFAPAAPMTIHMWAYPTRGGDMHLIGKRSNCYDSGQSANYQIGQDGTHGLTFSSGGILASSGQQMIPNQWQHVAVTADGTTFRLYKNGQQIASAAGTLGANSNLAPVLIGGACPGVGATFPGLLDEVVIVNQALSAAEIAAIYNAGAVGICDTILAGTYTNLSLPDGASLGGNVTVLNVLTLGGIVNTGGFKLTLGCNATVAGAGGGNYVVGTVNKEYCGTGTFVYPVGTTPDNTLLGSKGNDIGGGPPPPEYTPVTANVTALGLNPSSLSVRVFDATLIGFDPLQSLSRNWELQETGDITADLTFTYLDGTITDVNGNEASYIVYRRNSNGTTDPMCLGPCVDTTNNILGPVTAVTQFSRWSGAALVPTAAGVDVSGQVLVPGGGGLRNAIVTLTDSRGVTRTARSSSFGYYRFEDVRVGETYVISVNSKRYIFTPRTVQVFDAVTGLDMTADGEQ